jgi:GAF domain-containing protein
VHLFEIDSAAPPDQARIRTHYKWCASGVPTPPEFDDAKGAPRSRWALAHGCPGSRAGETIAGHIRNFEDAVRRLLEVGSLKSTAAVPVFVDGHWWGFIGFDSCRRECEWSLSDLDTLRTLAELVGAAVGRMGRIKSVAEASHIIERSPTILYRLNPEKPFPPTYVSQNVRRYGYDAEKLLARPDK